MIPAAYMPALALAGAAVASQVLFVDQPTTATRCGASPPPSTAGSRSTSPPSSRSRSRILLDSYRKTRSLTARKQMKWLVWGTGTGVLPFFLFYAIPFALGREPRLAMELAGYIPLALIPLSLAYAVVKHRLMDVELIFRRTLVYILAIAAIVGMCLLVVNLFEVVLAQDHEPHVTIIAILSTLVVTLLFTPGEEPHPGRHRPPVLPRALQLAAGAAAAVAGPERRPRPRRAWRSACSTAWTPPSGVSALAAVPARRRRRLRHLPRRRLRAARTAGVRLPADGAAGAAPGRAASPCTRRRVTETFPEAGALDLSYYFPCRVKGELIAILGVGRKDGFEPLNSEEVDLLQALAGQAATAFMNGRLYHSLREKADELQGLTEYNENILESMDSGILVLDLEGRIVRWNRAMEALYGASARRGPRPHAWTTSSRPRSWRPCAAAWCSGRHEEIGQHLQAAPARRGRPRACA